MCKVRKIVVVACLLVAVAPAWSAQATLVSYWGMDDNAANTTVVNGVNTAYNGVLGGSTTATQQVAGKIGGAIDMAGGDFATINNARGLQNTMTGDYTVSLWVQADSGGNMGDGVLASFGSYGTYGTPADQRMEFQIGSNCAYCLGEPPARSDVVCGTSVVGQPMVQLSDDSEQWDGVHV